MQSSANEHLQPRARPRWAGVGEQLFNGYFYKQQYFQPQLSDFVPIRNRPLLHKKIGEGKKAALLLLQQIHKRTRGLVRHSIYFFIRHTHSLSLTFSYLPSR